ncbi:MAG: hypothetical protein RR983_10340, partial [Massilia sp.]
ACVCDAPGARQDRHACCGTMQLPEYKDATCVVARWHTQPGNAGPPGLNLPTLPILPTSPADLEADASLRA